MGGFVKAVKQAPKNIARDVKMGTNPKTRDADYYARTAQTIARTQGSAAAKRYADQMTKKGGIAGQGIASLDKNALSKASAQYDRDIARRNERRQDRKQAASITPAPEDVQSPAEQTQANQAMLNRMRMMQQQQQAARAANMDRARMMFERQNMMSPGPMPRQMQGIGGFRRQPPPGMYERMMPGAMRPVPPTKTPRGGFKFSRQPASQQEMMQKLQGMRGGMRPAVMPQLPNPRMPQPMPRNQASSPAFRYAAQNYNRLGGMQRTMPRPMEMMSRGERQQIGRIADSFQPRLMPMQNPYVGILQRGISSKGGGRTMPQRPPMSGKGGGRTVPQGDPSAMARTVGSFASRGFFG